MINNGDEDDLMTAIANEQLAKAYRDAAKLPMWEQQQFIDAKAAQNQIILDRFGQAIYDLSDIENASCTQQ